MVIGCGLYDPYFYLVLWKKQRVLVVKNITPQVGWFVNFIIMNHLVSNPKLMGLDKNLFFL